MNREELLKNAKPILFNTEMVQAILDGRKTVTRRKIDRDITNFCDVEVDGTLLDYQNCHGDFINPIDLCRYKVGDILYVRETWSIHECVKCQAGIPALGENVNVNMCIVQVMERQISDGNHQSTCRRKQQEYS